MKTLLNSAKELQLQPSDEDSMQKVHNFNLKIFLLIQIATENRKTQVHHLNIFHPCKQAQLLMA